MLACLPDKPAAQKFCRCIVLRAAQWALDMRSVLPTVDELRAATANIGEDMVKVMEANYDIQCRAPRPVVVCQGVPGLADAIGETISPRLVLTSPPYPGVYVNYHRWKMLGRREIRAPYWITNNLDGRGLSHYTMAARADRSLATYFERLTAGFRDVARLLDSESVVVQMVGFNDRKVQLARYLAAMESAGLVEVSEDSLATDKDGRLWRAVPGRRWWSAASARRDVARHTAVEVVLFHRLRRQLGS
jgi:hypothetical protein